MSKPHVLKSELVYEGFFDLRVDTLSLPGKQPATYTVLVAYEAVTVLAVTPEGKLIITHEYRHPTGQYLLGLPGGRLDSDDEPPIEAAKRELEEETGYVARHFKEIGVVYPFPAVCGQKIHYFLALDAVRKGPHKQEPYELIETLELTLEELFQRIERGEGVDGVLFPALAFYERGR